MENSDVHLPVPEAVDVALSLLAEDATIAEQLRDRLVNNLRVFLWSEAQKDIAGKNGVAVFTELYEKRAKFVIVLYRDGYGQTKWTRIEETAITSKLVHSGWKHVLVVSLDGTKPSWTPASQLWFGLEHFGLDVLAEVIEARFGELGGTSQPETIVERAARVSAEKNAKAKASGWRQSVQGVEETQTAVNRFWTLLSEAVAAINAAPSSMSIDLRTRTEVRQIRVDRAWTTISWFQHYSNVLDDASLFVREFAISKSSSSFVELETPIHETYFLPFLDWRTNALVWSARDSSDRNAGTGPSYSTERLVDLLLGRLMDRHGGVD